MNIELFGDVAGGISSQLDWSPVGTWAFAIVVVGALVLLGSFIPGFVSVVKTKNTADQSWVMWLVTVLGLAFLTLFYMLGSISTAQGNNGVPAPHFLLVCLCEGISLILSIYILVYKFINMSRAKKANITEQELCRRISAKR